MEADVRSSDTDDEVLAECSDEEEFNKLGVQVDHYWSPHPDIVISLYEKIAQNTVLEFNWKCCSERRNPDEESTASSASSQENATKSKETEPEVTDYDFEEESTPQLSRFGKTTTPKGGGKKKTTSLAGILSNMERHRILDQKATKVLNKSQRLPKPSPTSTSSTPQ